LTTTSVTTTTQGQSRAAMRVLTQLSVLYRAASEEFRMGKAGNISSGGLLLTCASAFVDDAILDLRFTLPSDILGVYPEETLAIDLRNNNVRRVGRSDLRRPFEEINVKARIVSSQVVSPGVYRYGIAFVNPDGFAREEIARYVHALQL